MSSLKAPRPATDSRSASPETSRFGTLNVEASIQSQPKKQALGRDAILATLAILAEWFPKTFATPTEPRRSPLKIGITHDIVARLPVTKKEAGAALSFYANGLSYLRSMTTGVARVDLDGNACGAVMADEAEAAQLKIAEIKERLKAKQAIAAAAAAASPQLQAPEPAPPVAPGPRRSVEAVVEPADTINPTIAKTPPATPPATPVRTAAQVEAYRRARGLGVRT